MKKIVATAVVVIAALLALILFLAYSGTVEVGADAAAAESVHWFLETTRESSIEARAEDIEPPELTPEMATAGLRAYEEMCVRCHGAPGVRPAEFARGLSPDPPALWEEPHDPAAAFWIVKHGLRMTAMPAFGVSHSDDELWPIVAFLQELPELDAAAYARRAVEAAGAGHGLGTGHGEGQVAASDGHSATSGNGHGNGEARPAAGD